MRTAPLLLALTLSLPAHAGLGDAATPVPTDQTVGGTVIRRAVPARSYTVQDIQSADGVSIREYVAADGKVFAVSWSGPVMPNLVQLFGAYFGSYRGALGNRTTVRGPVRVKRSDLVVESGGHMRAFRGRAYLPHLLPAGVAAAEIR